jgi:hypothetical protein
MLIEIINLLKVFITIKDNFYLLIVLFFDNYTKSLTNKKYFLNNLKQIHV